MSLKIEFVRRASAPNANVSALCREFGITRQTGHKWLNRFNESGYDGLEEHSRRPQLSPLGSAEDIVVAIVEARDAHPTWGPHKLRHLLMRRLGNLTPSESTIGRVLKRFNKIRRRKHRPPLSVVTQAPVVKVEAPNDVWTVDYKGWWRARNGERCEPLTVRDAHSRFILAIEVLSGTNMTDARSVFERLFKRYGVPKAIQCDNGSPFIASNARGGLSKLSAWWISLGIKVIRSRPGCPQDNGAHERMHADMASEIQVVPRSNRHTQQQACSKWRQEFNHVRPHDALNGKSPADVYTRSERVVCKHKVLYPSDWLVRKVSGRGQVKISTEEYFVSTSLCGYSIGLQPVDVLHWRAWFYDVDLGTIEIAPTTIPDALMRRASRISSLPTCSNASSVRARSKHAPAKPRLTRSARVSQPQLPKTRNEKRSRSTA
jgi:Transposase and inactivated derivatives